MFSAPGFTSVAETEAECRRRLGDGFSDGAFRDTLCTYARIHLYDKDNRALVTVSQSALAWLDGDYAFVRRPAWSITLDVVRSFVWGDSDNAVRIGMYFAADAGDRFPDTQFGVDLEKHEGWFVSITNDDSAKVIEAMCEPLAFFDKSDLQFSDAVKAAKLRRIQHMDDGPKVPSDKVLLMELCLAIDQLEGCDLDCGYQYCSAGYECVLSALRQGDLVARTLSEDHVIGRSCWPVGSSGSEMPYSAYYSDFWNPLISSETQCAGMIGETPLLRETEVMDWFKGCKLQRQPPEKRPMSRAETAKQFKEWVKEFEEPKKPTKDERLAWGKERGLTVERVRELVKENAPAYWSISGRPKKG